MEMPVGDMEERLDGSVVQRRDLTAGGNGTEPNQNVCADVECRHNDCGEQSNFRSFNSVVNSEAFQGRA